MATKVIIDDVASIKLSDVITLKNGQVSLKITITDSFLGVTELTLQGRNKDALNNLATPQNPNA